MNLSCDSLQFTYSSYHTFSVLNNLISIKHFELKSSAPPLWISGLSGSGKSTFLKLLAGYLAPTKGSIKWGETDLTKLNEKQRTLFRFKNIAFSHQENKLFDHWTFKQNLSIISSTSSAWGNFYKELGFNETHLDKRVQHLSGGERQRLDLLRVLIRQPKIALLDEPTSHLDDFHAELLLKQIKNNLNNSLVIIVSHDRRLESYVHQKINFSEINQ